MNDVIIYAVISLSLVGAAAAVVLYFIAQKFKVIEDPKIDEVEESLPAANCGGCGFPGCRGFAEALVKSANEKQSLFFRLLTYLRKAGYIFLILKTCSSSPD